MNQVKLIITILPFLIVMYVNFLARYSGTNFYGTFPKLLEIFLNFSPLIIYVLWNVITRPPTNLLQMVIRASYFVYLFYLFNYTLLTIPFERFLVNELLPVYQQTFPMYNLVPLNRFHISLTPTAIIGNLVLLLPLGIYWPLIYPKLTRLSRFSLATIGMILFIEGSQFIFSYIDGLFTVYPYARSFDVDDFISNFISAVVGFALVKYMIKPMIITIEKRIFIDYSN